MYQHLFFSRNLILWTKQTWKFINWMKHENQIKIKSCTNIHVSVWFIVTFLVGWVVQALKRLWFVWNTRHLIKHSTGTYIITWLPRYFLLDFFFFNFNKYLHKYFYRKIFKKHSNVVALLLNKWILDIK